MRIARFLGAVAVCAGFAAAPALAAGPQGEWLRVDGKARIRLAPCGEAMCGVLTWLKPGETTPARVGQRVFYDLKPAGEGVWQGSAFNPEDGRTYAGKLTVNGDKLNTAGCVLGGLICKSQDWARFR